MDTENKVEQNLNEEVELELIVGGIDLSDPLKPYIARHSYKYDFTFLTNHLLHPQLARDMASAFAIRLSKVKKTRGKQKHHTVKKIEKAMFWLFNYLDSGKQTTFKLSVKQSFKEGVMPEGDDWQKVMDAFRAAIFRTKNNPFVDSEAPNTLRTFKDAVKPYLDCCKTLGLLPGFNLKAKKNSSAGLKQGKNKLLSDLSRKKLSEKNVEKLLGGYLDMKVAEHDIIEREKRAAIISLATTGIDVSGLNDDEIVQEIYRVNKSRLAELRRVAEEEFSVAWKIYLEGQELLESCDLSYEDDISEPLEDFLRLHAEGMNGMSPELRYHPLPEMFLGEFESVWSGASRRVPLPYEVFLPRVLTLIDGRYGKHGRTIKYPLEKPLVDLFKNAFRQQTSKQGATTGKYGKAGFQGLVKARLGASNDTLYAGFLILLLDTAHNISVIEDLTVDCLRDTDDPSIKKIWGIKDRADYNVVDAFVRIDDPDQKINAVEVVRAIEEMTHRFRKLATVGEHRLYKIQTADVDVVKRLFIREAQRQNERPENDDELTAFFEGGLGINVEKGTNRFRERWPQIGAYGFTPDAIRTTINVLGFMDGKSIESVQTKMGHARVDTTSGYIFRSFSRTALTQQVREFQRNLEAIMISDIEGAAQKLGYTVREFDECLEGAERTGLGSLCFHLKKDKNGNIVSEKPDECDPVEDCPECPLIRVFPALRENLLDALTMRDWIKRNKDRLIAENITRYRNVWLRWLAITEGVIDKAKSDINVDRAEFRAAEKLAEELSASSFLPYQ